MCAPWGVAGGGRENRAGVSKAGRAATSTADAFLSRRHWVLRDLLNHLLFSLTFPRHAVLPKLVPATHERGWGGKKTQEDKRDWKNSFLLRCPQPRGREIRLGWMELEKNKC